MPGSDHDVAGQGRPFLLRIQAQEGVASDIGNCSDGFRLRRPLWTAWKIMTTA
jgi:hypothetical protein